MTAELVGIGVGPGNPDLVTLAAVHEFRTADRIFVPVLAPDAMGRAEAVVRTHLPPDRLERLERLVFALNDDVNGSQQRRQEHWDVAATRVVAHLREHGGTAVFATLGDPSVYSTFGYLAGTVRELFPQLRIRTVPGITAMQAAASAAGLTLVEGTEPLTLLPLSRDFAGDETAEDGADGHGADGHGADGHEAAGGEAAGDGVAGDRHGADDALSVALARGGTVVVYKGGRRLAEVRKRVAAAGALDRAWCAEHLGTLDQQIVPLAEVEAETASYLSTLLILPPRGGRGAQL